MKSFLMKTITEEKVVDGLAMGVTRARNSNGFASITISVGGKSISFTNEKETDNDYESQAQELAIMIAKIVDNPCLLPELKD